MAKENRQAELARAFGAEEANREPGAELGPVLAQLCDQARSAWPDLALADEAFCRYLGERLAPEELSAAARADEPLPIAELFLACGCALGIPGASQHFVRTYRDATRAALARVAGPADRDEVMQRVWERLLVARAGELPRIAQYKGRSALGAFVRVTAVRLAITMLRKESPVAAGDDEIERLASDSENPEVQYLKQLYREEFRRSFANALAALPPHQRLLLRLDIVDHLTIDQAALVYGRSRTTTGRHLLEARQALAEVTMSDLRNRLSLPVAEMPSVARLIRSHLDLSVHRLLAAAESDAG